MLCRNDIQRAGVQYIIDSVVVALLEDEERRLVVIFSLFGFSCLTITAKDE